MKKLSILTILIFNFYIGVYSKDSSCIFNNDAPFFPGTLLQFAAKVLEPGHYAVQPYLLLARFYGSYDRFSDLKNDKNIHQYEALLFLKAGIIKNLDMEVIINGAYTHSKFGDSFLYGDTLVLLGFQLAKSKKKTFQPDIKLLIGENFPTGKYQNLDPQKNGIDGMGLGTHETFFILSAGKIIYPYFFNPVNLNLNLYYIQPVKTSINGSSVYGGGAGTKGSVLPGQEFIANLGIEYSISCHWNAGIDIRYKHQNSSIFYPSSSNSGPLAGLPSSELFTLAPCLEYNLNKNFGINCGVWFSLKGRNTDAFTTPILSFFYYY